MNKATHGGVVLKGGGRQKMKDPLKTITKHTDRWTDVYPTVIKVITTDLDNTIITDKIDFNCSEHGNFKMATIGFARSGCPECHIKYRTLADIDKARRKGGVIPDDGSIGSMIVNFINTPSSRKLDKYEKIEWINNLLDKEFGKESVKYRGMDVKKAEKIDNTIKLTAKDKKTYLTELNKIAFDGNGNAQAAKIVGEIMGYFEKSDEIAIEIVQFDDIIKDKKNRL